MIDLELGFSSCRLISFLCSTARGMHSKHLYELRSLVEENLIIAKSLVYVTGGPTRFLIDQHPIRSIYGVSSARTKSIPRG